MTCAISCHSVAGPVECARRPRLRRIERDDAAEAGAEGADNAGQADRAHGEVVVLREHLDEDRPGRLELVLLRQRGERLPAPAARRARASPPLRPGCRRTIEVAVGDRLELVERVEHRERVVSRRRRSGSALNAVSSDSARARLVAGAQQVHAEIGVRPRAAASSVERAARQLAPPRRSGSCARGDRRPRGRRRRRPG